MDQKRKTPRRTLKYGAYVESADFAELIPVELLDISSGGAKLKAKDAEAIPASFVLLLAVPNGPRRKCRVVWRAGTDLGVRIPDGRRLLNPDPLRCVTIECPGRSSCGIRDRA